jgi:hypothetical protein
MTATIPTMMAFSGRFVNVLRLLCGALLLLSDDLTESCRLTLKHYEESLCLPQVDRLVLDLTQKHGGQVRNTIGGEKQVD